MAKEKTFIRNPAVTETDIDDEIFLVEPASEEVFYMDTVSAGLWRLLAEPSSFEEIAAVYGAPRFLMPTAHKLRKTLRWRWTSF